MQPQFHNSFEYAGRHLQVKGCVRLDTTKDTQNISKFARIRAESRIRHDPVVRRSKIGQDGVNRRSAVSRQQVVASKDLDRGLEEFAVSLQPHGDGRGVERRLAVRAGSIKDLGTGGSGRLTRGIIPSWQSGEAVVNIDAAEVAH